MRAEVAYCGEGLTDAAVARRLIVACGGVPGPDYVSTRLPRGKDSLDSRLRGLDAYGRAGTILVLRDMDSDADCPGELATRLLPARQAGTVFRIAVRSVEAWLMADREAFASALRLAPALLPSEPETLERPKTFLADLLEARADRETRRRLGMDGRIGRPQPQLLAAALSGFASGGWNPDRAARASATGSLVRAMSRLRATITAVR